MEEKNFSRIEIKSCDLENGSIFNEVYIDGHKLKGVRSFRLEHKAGDSVPTLTLDLNAIATTVDGFVLTCAEGFGEIKIDFLDRGQSEESPL